MQTKLNKITKNKKSMIDGGADTSLMKSSPFAGLAIVRYRDRSVEWEVFFASTALVAASYSSNGLPILPSSVPVTRLSLYHLIASSCAAEISRYKQR